MKGSLVLFNPADYLVIELFTCLGRRGSYLALGSYSKYMTYYGSGMKLRNDLIVYKNGPHAAFYFPLAYANIRLGAIANIDKYLKLHAIRPCFITIHN